MRISETLERELEQLNDEIRRLDSEAATQMEAAEKLVADIRSSGTNPLVDQDAFEKVDEAYLEADKVRENASQLRQRREKLLGRFSDDGEGGGYRAVAPRRAGWGGAVRAFTETPEYQRLATLGAFDSKSTHIEVPGVEVMDREETIKMLQSGGSMRMRAATAVVDPMVEPDMRLFPPVPIPVRPIKVTELVFVSTTDSDQVDFVEETTRTDVAAERLPGVASPEASYVYTNKTAQVRDISHWTPAHKRNLADEGQIRGLLEGRLESGVDRRLETQIVSGDGIAPNLTGILNTTGIGSIARNVAGSEPRLEAIHRGITTVRLALFDEPDAIGLHPTDYEETVFEKGSDGHWLLGPASQQTSRTIWGFPVAVTSAFPANTALVGNYRTGAILWMRSGVVLSASDSPGDMFLERRVALMAELRAAFAAWQLQAFCAVTSM